MPGPAPKPTALRIVEGNRSHRPLPANEPKPKQVVPDCPDHLDATAKKEWYRLVPILMQMRVLTEADYIALSALCQTYSRLIQAQEQLAKSSLILKTKSGYAQPSPLIGVINTCTEQVVKLCREFGLSPASRVKLVADPETKQDTDDDLIR